jgi:hypothetical protein
VLSGAVPSARRWSHVPETQQMLEPVDALDQRSVPQTVTAGYRSPGHSGPRLCIAPISRLAAEIGLRFLNALLIISLLARRIAGHVQRESPSALISARCGDGGPDSEMLVLRRQVSENGALRPLALLSCGRVTRPRAHSRFEFSPCRRLLKSDSRHLSHGGLTSCRNLDARARLAPRLRAAILRWAGPICNE